MQIEFLTIRISSRPILIVHFGPIQNSTTNLSRRSQFRYKFDYNSIKVDRFWSFILLKLITFDLFSIKRSKKTVYMSIILSKKSNLIENVFYHFWLKLNYFWLKSSYFLYKWSGFESNRCDEWIGPLKLDQKSWLKDDSNQI